MKKIKNISILVLTLFLAACAGEPVAEGDTATEDVVTPVTVTSVQTTFISESISLNATGVYQRKNSVRATIGGYIEKSFTNLGDYVKAGQLLYVIKTKEADALGNYSMGDSIFSFKGIIKITAPPSGIITEVLKLQNDYVADGDALATIAEQSSFVFVLKVPYEYNKYTAPGTACNILLADSSKLTGTIIGKMPLIDAATQTQDYILKPHTNSALPENLLASVQIIKKSKPNTQVLDKNCVLTDETMQQYWVMKLVNDSTAIKIPVTKGITADENVEILSPIFDPADRIINSGNYGLPDTAFINIIQP